MSHYYDYGQRRRSSVLGWIIAFVVTALIITGIVIIAQPDPPKQLKAAAEALPGQIKAVRQNVNNARTAYDQKLATDKYSFMNGYSAEQKHLPKFDMANSKVAEADKTYQSVVKPIMDDYEDAKKAKLQAAVDQANKLRTDAEALAGEPTAWADKVAATKANPAEAVRQGTETAQAVKANQEGLGKEAAKAQQQFPERTDKVIAQRLQPLADLQSQTATVQRTLLVESRQGAPNYAVMTAAVEQIKSNNDVHTKDAATLRNQLHELPATETHTLVDFRVDTYVEVSRTSWDDCCDGDEKSYDDYPAVLVEDLEAANYFHDVWSKWLEEKKKDKDTDDLVLAVDGSGGFKAKDIKGKYLKFLNITEPRKDWPKDHTNSEFYFEEVWDHYCQQVMVIVNGKPDTSKRPKPEDNYCSKYDTPDKLAAGTYWVEVGVKDDDDPRDRVRPEDIGMDIYSKGAGDFADEANLEATPPGMAYVGNPDAGEWREDEGGGGPYWFFYYGYYSNYLEPTKRYHYRSEWDTWNSKHRYAKKAYYPARSGVTLYGAKSPYVANRFPGSTFMKSGLQDATVRNSGPIARSGGPGAGK